MEKNVVLYPILNDNYIKYNIGKRVSPQATESLVLG